MALLQAADEARETLKTRPVFSRIGKTMPDGSIYAGLSPDAGRPMYTTPADTAEKLSYNDAQRHAKSLVALGHDDWSLPTKAEAQLLTGFFNIGATEKRYDEPEGHWSSTQSIDGHKAWLIHESTGQPLPAPRTSANPVRIVRYG